MDYHLKRTEFKLDHAVPDRSTFDPVHRGASVGQLKFTPFIPFSGPFSFLCHATRDVLYRSHSGRDRLKVDRVSVVEERGSSAWRGSNRNTISSSVCALCGRSAATLWHYCLMSRTDSLTDVWLRTNPPSVLKIHGQHRHTNRPRAIILSELPIFLRGTTEKISARSKATAGRRVPRAALLETVFLQRSYQTPLVCALRSRSPRGSIRLLPSRPCFASMENLELIWRPETRPCSPRVDNIHRWEKKGSACHWKGKTLANPIRYPFFDIIFRFARIYSRPRVIIQSIGRKVMGSSTMLQWYPMLDGSCTGWMVCCDKSADGIVRWTAFVIWFGVLFENNFEGLVYTAGCIWILYSYMS